MIHVYPVNHRTHVDVGRRHSFVALPGLKTDAVISKTKLCELDATSTDTLQLISLIHFDILVQLKQIHCICSMFPGVLTTS